MKEQKLQKNQIKVMLLPEYGRQKLLMYADSFNDLADVFTRINEESEQRNHLSTGEDRSAFLYHRKIYENREIMADHLKEMAQIISEAAKVSFAYIPLPDKLNKKIVRALKQDGILVKEIYYIKNEDEKVEVVASLAIEKGKERTGEEVADLLSVLLDARLMLSKETDYYLDEKYRDFHFLEEPGFVVLTGVAKAVKENESVSGDNYCEFEEDKRTRILMLSDGMGSGEKACADSLRVLDLMERMLSAGFSLNMAVQMVNTSLNVGGSDSNLSTLDICSYNLYEGFMELTKVGAASTFIKRDSMVEQISSRNLPLGVFGHLEPESVKRKLMDGDYVVMVSDGVIEGLSEGIGEEGLSEIISRTQYENPKEMANYILNYVIRVCRGSIKDDMTVIVSGIWENT